MSGEVTPGDRFWAKVDKSGDCWEWTGAIQSNGYGAFSASDGVHGRICSHRYSFWLSNGHLPEGLDICHRCDNRKCVRPDHLFIGTRGDNIRDARDKGRLKLPDNKFGERNHSARLTSDAATAIRDRRATGESLRILSLEYGVSKTTVSRIGRGLAWPHLAEGSTR